MNRSYIKTLFTLSVAALLMVGCVIKPYKSPTELPIDDAMYRIDSTKVENSQVDSSTIASIPWREFFQDPLLRNLIDSVLANNIDLKIAVRNVDKMYAYVRQSRAAFAPSINSGASVEHILQTKGSSTTVPNLQVSLGASWEIDIWGKLLSAKRSAIAQMIAEKDTYQAVQTTLVAETAKAYYQLVALDIERKIVIGTIANRAEYLATTRLLKESAKVDEVAVQQAKAQMAEVMAALPDLEMAIERVENQISLLLGDIPHSIERADIDDLHGVEFSERAGYPVQLLANRPDVRAAEQNYRTAFEQYNVSRAALYPSLTLSANGAYGASLSDIVNVHMGTLNLLAGLAQPVFNGRKLRTQKNVSDLTAQQAELNFKKAILSAGLEVSNAIISARKYREKAVNQTIQLDALNKAYTYSSELLVNGYATYLDVLLAQTGVYNTRVALVETILSSINARIDLYRALGGGVQ